MVEGQLVIKYDGGDAISHTIEMRALGLSLIGFEKIISDGLIFMGNDRLPRRRERHQLVVKAQGPAIGSTEIPFQIAQSLGLLPFGWWLLQTGATEVVGGWLTYVFAKLSGRTNEAAMALDALSRAREQELAAKAQSEARWLEHEAAWRDQLFALTARLVPSAIKAVAPIGPSVDRAELLGASLPPFVIDLPTADAIRAKGELEVTELQETELRIDGFVHHTKKLNVENPDAPGTYLSADVRDPAFDIVPNAYTEAANVKGVLRVQVKLGYRAGQLEKIYVLNHCERDAA
ncbi:MULTISPECIES: hypothetical protein [Sphingobium]|uniref:DUF7946 domain-containing protein n=1 Tax=Sphingobium TaxID=165695 RepID=UPI0015EBB140|nr:MULTISPECIES: hypothetical protein [Sphingobium]MCW2361630.1 hypothetical protein [Sphingobium sp. B10D3B]MCW2401691.1 hypothetical protein [Sphingobium sp. B10D7B]MCW2408671.1 hypothetical protein [Sphingobium xanthum]